MPAPTPLARLPDETSVIGAIRKALSLLFLVDAIQKETVSHRIAGFDNAASMPLQALGTKKGLSFLH